MKKILKYLGILVILVLVFGVSMYFLGVSWTKSDLALLSQLQVDSEQYYAENGDFSTFCSSELYAVLESDFAYDISCRGGESERGDGTVITAEVSSKFFTCKPANLPPTDGVPRKAITCVQIPEQVYNFVK